MDRMDLEDAFAAPEPIKNWPGVTEQPVRRITWRQEALLTRLVTANEQDTASIMEQVMTAILPGRTWDEIQDTLDAEMMQGVIAHASTSYKKVRAELEQLAGNAAAGAVPASPPPTPTAPSSPPSPALTAVPCGAS